jgi:hypothetical protein
LKSLQELGELDKLNRVGEFAQYCRLLMLGRGSTQDTLSLARGHASQRVVELIQKATVLPMGGGGAGTGAEALTSPVLKAFTDSLRFSSAFVAAVNANMFVRTPLNTLIGMVMSGASAASEVGPGDAVPMRKLDLAGATVARRKSRRHGRPQRGAPEGRSAGK